jgi:NADH-ubiquinone oxidoreductase chain 5
MSTTVLAIIAFFEVGFDNIIVSANLFKWMDSEWFNILWDFQFNSLTVAMLIPVLIISSLVHLYSIGYMNGDPHNQRFFSYLSLFTFMMIILVTANNYLLMFVGWEGVGVCSYLLVSFWFTRIAANQSSISAFLTNRVGDCFLTIGIFAVLWCLGNLDYTAVFSLSSYINENTITIIGICLLIGAMAKSSQVGLHVWLPMAMEGPTPVSALIHAATMVTAGVYLLMRSSPLIEYSSTLLLLCLWLGAITTVFSSLVGLFQQDIKKVIAYSTMSQLGMMVIAIGLSSYNVALFHLINHAFYKGLLFLGAGAVIHAVADNQDFRKYGGLISFLPLSYSVILIASLSLVAFPFMTGFYSKDFILESAYGQYCFSGITVYIIAVIGAIFTTLYSVKVLYLTFLTNPNGSIMYYKNAHESDIFISLPLVILAIFSIFFGFIAKDIFVGLGSNFFVNNSLFIHPDHEIMINTEFAVPSLFKLLPFIFTITFTMLAIILSEFLSETVANFKLSILGKTIFGFFNQRFLVELFYNKYITRLVLDLGGQTTKVLDKGSIELLGPYGLQRGFIILSKAITNLNKGIVTEYGLYNLIGLIALMFIPLLKDLDMNTIILIVLAIFIVVSIVKGTNYNDSFVLQSNLVQTNSSYVLQSNFIKVFDFDLKKKILDLKERIFNKKFFVKTLLLAIISIIVRICILEAYNVDIFRDFENFVVYPVYTIFFFFRSIISSIIDLLFEEKKGDFMTMGNNISDKKSSTLNSSSIKLTEKIPITTLMENQGESSRSGGESSRSGGQNPQSIEEASSSRDKGKGKETSIIRPRSPRFVVQTLREYIYSEHGDYIGQKAIDNKGLPAIIRPVPGTFPIVDVNGYTGRQIDQIREEVNAMWGPPLFPSDTRYHRGLQFIYTNTREVNKMAWYEFVPVYRDGFRNGYFSRYSNRWEDVWVTNTNAGAHPPYPPSMDPTTPEGRANLQKHREKEAKKWDEYFKNPKYAASVRRYFGVQGHSNLPEGEIQWAHGAFPWRVYTGYYNPYSYPGTGHDNYPGPTNYPGSASLLRRPTSPRHYNISSYVPGPSNYNPRTFIDFMSSEAWRVGDVFSKDRIDVPMNTPESNRPGSSSNPIVITDPANPGSSNVRSSSAGPSNVRPSNVGSSSRNPIVITDPANSGSSNTEQNQPSGTSNRGRGRGRGTGRTRGISRGTGRGRGRGL